MARNWKVDRLKCFQSARIYLNSAVGVVEAGALAEAAEALDFVADLVVEEEVDFLHVVVAGEDSQHTRIIEQRSQWLCCII